MTNQSLNANFANLYKDCNGTISALRAYSEYSKSFANKVMRFLEKPQTRTEEYITVEIPGDDPADSYITYVSKTNYDKLVDGTLDSLDCVITSSGQTVNVEADVILDSIENSLAEVQLQSEFIDVCLDNAEHKVTDFITIVQSKYAGVSGSLISKYQDMWDSASPFESLKNLLNNRESKEFSNTDGEISIFNKDEYDGGAANLFGTAMLEVFSDIGSFFNKVWQGIQDLQGFFKRIWDGIVNLLKYVIGKAFGQLLTNYEKGSDKVGILDVPLLQAPLFHVYMSKNPNGKGYIGKPIIATDMDHKWISPNADDPSNISSDTSSAIKEELNPFYMTQTVRVKSLYKQDEQDPDASVKVNDYLRRCDYDNWRAFNTTVSDGSLDNCDKMIDTLSDIVNANAIVHQLFYLDDETHALYPRLLDIVIPCSQTPDFVPVAFPRNWSVIKYNPCDVLARYGVVKVRDVGSTTEFMVCLQLYPIINWDQVNNSPDVVTACNLWDTVYALGEYLTTKYWIVLKGHSGDSLGLTKNEAASMASYFASRCIDLDFTEIERWTEPDAGTFDLVSKLGMADSITFNNNGQAISQSWTNIFNDLESDYEDGHDLMYTAASTVIFISAILKYSAFAGPGYCDNNGNPFNDDSVLTPHIGANLYVVNKDSLLYVSQLYPIASDITCTYESISNTYHSGLWYYSDGHGHSWPDDPYLPFRLTPATVQENVNEYILNMNTFTPYSSYCPFGISVHYQTYREQVTEMKTVIWAAIIAIVGVTLAIVGHKFKKKRIIKAQLAQARLDSMSWDIAQNPTKAQLKEFAKANKSLKRINKMNSLLGIGSSEDSNARIISAIGQVKTQLLSTQGYDINDVEVKGATINDVKVLISGS